MYVKKHRVSSSREEREEKTFGILAYGCVPKSSNTAGRLEIESVAFCLPLPVAQHGIVRSAAQRGKNVLLFRDGRQIYLLVVFTLRQCVATDGSTTAT